MNEYRVVLTARFETELKVIEDDQSRYSLSQRQHYADSILQHCADLDILPERYASLEINGRTYRSFTHGGHRVFYRVDGDQVLIIALIHARQLPEKHL